jgi:hypothetical protein
MRNNPYTAKEGEKASVPERGKEVESWKLKIER